MIKQAPILFGEDKENIQKTPAVQDKEVFSQTLVSGTQTEILDVMLVSQIGTDKHLDTIITLDKRIVSNFNGNE